MNIASATADKLRELKAQRSAELRALELPLSTATHFDAEIEALEEELFA